MKTYENGKNKFAELFPNQKADLSIFGSQNSKLKQ